jgi:hypothetical protein
MNDENFKRFAVEMWIAGDRSAARTFQRSQPRCRQRHRFQIIVFLWLSAMLLKKTFLLEAPEQYPSA